MNLDPAAESFTYKPSLDVRELVTVADVMEEMELGPNGALVYSMEYLLENLNWLEVGTQGHATLRAEQGRNFQAPRSARDSFRSWLSCSGEYRRS